MKKMLSINLVMGVVILFLSVSFTPVIHATSIQSTTNYSIPLRNKCDIENGSNLTFWICQLSLDGITFISWAPLFGLYVLFNGTIHIKSFTALDINANKYGNYFGTYNLTGNFTAILRHFIFKHSSEPNQMEGYALNVILIRSKS
ncbi:Uncharacterised protein [uncultured archaeon]|nr:Uncharacterised protein [uncultured archaeon]